MHFYLSFYILQPQFQLPTLPMAVTQQAENLVTIMMVSTLHVDYFSYISRNASIPYTKTKL